MIATGNHYYRKFAARSTTAVGIPSENRRGLPHQSEDWFAMT